MAMAKQLEQFKKEFQAINNKALEYIRTLTQFETSNNNARAFIAEGAIEIGLRVQKIKNTGFQGKTLKDFMGDPAVKKAVAEIDAMVNRRETELGKMIQLKGKGLELIKSSQKLGGEMQAEIASRKKQLSTKLGIGNKSLPGMIAELEKLRKALSDKGALYELKDMLDNLDRPGEWKEKRDDAVETELGKTKDAAISSQQRALLKQALDQRHLATMLARVTKLKGDFDTAAKLAAVAKKSNKPSELKKAKTDAAAAVKNLVTTVEPLEKAVKDPFVSSQVRNSKDASSIIDKVQKMVAMRDAAVKQLKIVAAL